MAGTCGGPMMGGRRKTRRGSRRQRGGALYGFGGAMGTNGPVWNGVANTNFVNSATGQEIPNDPPKVGGRRRKSRKGSKKSRKSRRRQRGGASQVSMGGTYASFQGSGVRGMADYVPQVKPGNPI